MKLTAKQAIKLDMDMWEWLSKNHGDKSDYPFYEKYGIGNMENHCPCCEIWLANNCVGCPLNYKKYCEDGRGEAWIEWLGSFGDNEELHGALMIYRQLARAYKKLDKTNGA
jgi:hypothetical protein